MNYKLVSAFALGLLTMIAVCSATSAAPPDDPQAAEGERQPAEETVTIPLDRIWSNGMPGTHHLTAGMRGRPPKYISAEGRLLYEMLRSLSRHDTTGSEGAEPGFAVLGTGMEALRQAHDVLVMKEKPRESFPVGREITVVFFSYTVTSYVHIDRVERRGNVVEIQYHLVPHMTRNLSQHFALVPLGKLSAGTVKVDIVRAPWKQAPVDQGISSDEFNRRQRIVCKSFSFSVVNHQND